MFIVKCVLAYLIVAAALVYWWAGVCKLNGTQDD